MEQESDDDDDSSNIDSTSKGNSVLFQCIVLFYLYIKIVFTYFIEECIKHFKV